MIIIYEDEYGNGVYWGTSTYTASVGDTVVVEDEEYRVKSRMFFPQEDKVIITITQNMLKPRQSEDSGNGRLNEMNNAIIQINKRQDAQEKSNRNLREQVGTVRKHINQQIRKERKDT